MQPAVACQLTTFDSPLAIKSSLTLILGYTQATFEASAGIFDIHDNFGGVSYGAGVDIEIKEDLSTNIEYMQFFDTVGIELTGFSVGLTKHF